MNFNLKKIFFIIVFNFNIIGLPAGVMWSNVVSPIMFYWIFKKRHFAYVLVSFFLLCVYIILQTLSMPIVNPQGYVLGALYFYTSVLVGIFFYLFFNDKKYGPKYIENIFKLIIKTNVFLTILAIVIYFTPLKELVWIVSDNVNSYGEIRLKLFFSEPSHTSFIYCFFALYLFLNILFYPEKKYWILFVMTILSIFLGKSLGTIGTMLIAITIGFIIFFFPLVKRFYKKLLILLVILIILIPLVGGSLTSRLNKFVEGGDNSGNVRLVYATVSAYNMIEKYNYYFGVGFGQTKEYVTEFTSKISGYGSARLPNTFASTLATVGIVGILIKFLFLFYFFIKTKVYSNIFRLITFFYIFLYGFSGGWMFNVYEFILWAFTFSTVFSNFDNKIIFRRFNA